MTVVFGVFCCTLACLVLPTTSNREGFNGLFPAYYPGVFHGAWQISDFPAIEEAGPVVNAIPQLHLDGLPVFPMPYGFQGLLERRDGFSIRIMNSSWSGLAETNVFHKGEQLYLQVSASPGPGQQLYIQSCYASSSPNPADKPDVMLILNKGCVASKESVVKFVLQKSDRVNFLVRVLGLKSSTSYIHCKVHLSSLGLTSTTKFCNYNKLKSRWVDLVGQTSACDCCGRRCRSLIEYAELPDLTVVVSTGPLTLKDQQSLPQATPQTPSDYNPVANTLSDNRWIVAGASFSGNALPNMGVIPPWPIQPDFEGGMMVISQRLGGDVSMWLPSFMEYEFNPVMPIGAGYPANAFVNLEVQSDEPFGRLNPDEGAVEKSQTVAVDEEMKNNVDALGSLDASHVELGVWNINDFTQFQIEEKPVEDELEGHQTTSNPTQDEGEAFFRRAEMAFEGTDGGKLSGPFRYSKLSLNQAADGSSSLNYEEQKRPSVQKDKTSKLQRDDKNGQNDVQFEEPSGIQALVSSLLEKLSSMWK